MQFCWLHIHEVLSHPLGGLLDWDLVTVKAILVQWTHYHVQETNMRLPEVYDMMCYPAGNRHQRMQYCYKEMDTVSNNSRLLNDAQLVPKGPKYTRKISPTTLPHHLQHEPLIQGMILLCFHAFEPTFCFCYPNYTALIWTSILSCPIFLSLYGL